MKGGRCTNSCFNSIERGSSISCCLYSMKGDSSANSCFNCIERDRGTNYCSYSMKRDSSTSSYFNSVKRGRSSSSVGQNCNTGCNVRNGTSSLQTLNG